MQIPGRAAYFLAGFNGAKLSGLTDATPFLIGFRSCAITVALLKSGLGYWPTNGPTAIPVAAAAVIQAAVLLTQAVMVKRVPFLLASEPVLMRCALYARVSTDDRGQDPENQLLEMRAWCAHVGHSIVREYVEHESGRKGTEGRQELARLMADASLRRFDLVLFWSIDRFSREGMVPTVLRLQRLSSYGVSFHSYTEPYLATDNELARDILLAALSSLAKLEAKKISDRTKAGMARAKEKGRHMGRPALPEALQRRIAGLAGAHKSPRSRTTPWRAS